MRRVDSEHMELLGHSQLHDVVISFLNMENIVKLRLVSQQLSDATEKAIVDDLCEYILCGNEYRAPSKMWQHAVVVDALKLWNHPEFATRVYPIMTEASTVPSLRRAHVWTNFGNTRPRDTKRRTTFEGKEYSPHQCYIKAVEIDDTLPRAWYNIGWSMGDKAKETIVVRGQTMTGREAVLQSLRLNPDYSRAWATLGMIFEKEEDSPVLNGKRYSETDCFAQALRCESKPTSDTWYNLGVTNRSGKKIDINGLLYSSRDCMLQSISIDPDYTLAWSFLGGDLQKPVGDDRSADDHIEFRGRRYDRFQCLQRALNLRQQSDAARDFPFTWYAMAETLSALPTSYPCDGKCVLANGSEYTATACYVKAAMASERFYQFIVGPYGHLRQGDEVDVAGVLYRVGRHKIYAAGSTPRESSSESESVSSSSSHMEEEEEDDEEDDDSTQ